MFRPAVTALSLFILLPSVVPAEPLDQARQILRQSGIQGGLILHLGCGDGRLAAAMGKNDSFVVQGLGVDAEQIEKARKHIRSLGRYGRISVSRWDGQRLPYAGNLVNLIVADKPIDVADEEIMRVLAPRGVAMLMRDGAWEKLVKPVPDEIDDWPHYLYGPDNNAVSKDMTVGPPQQMQWVCGPKYARSHEINSSMAAMVSAGGRLFYIWDDGPTGLTDARFPAKWSLICRDAFNGTLLWKQPMPNWGWREWHDPSRWEDKRERAKMLRNLPATTPRRLVASDDRLYATLGYEAPVSVLDPATGKVLQEYQETTLADEILLDDGMLVLRVRVADHRPDRDMWGTLSERQSGRVMVVDADSARVLWKSEPESMAPLSLATRGGRVFYSNYDQIVCLERASGQELWRSESVQSKQGHRGTHGTLVAQDDVVLHATATGGHNGELRVYSTKTGELLWTGPRYSGPGITNPPDLFVASGLAWVGETRLPVDIWETKMWRQGYDPVSGEVVREVSVPMLTSPGHHYRCYRSKATERYLMLPKRGIEFLDLVGKDHMRHDWLRPPCVFGVMPGNGMLYVAPHQCVCYQGVLMSNFNAVTAKSDNDISPLPNEERLCRGPAWGKATQGDRASREDWPMYRQNPRRSGSVATEVPDDLQQRWEVALSGNITPPVVADGRLFVAQKDTHTVHAMDSKTGKPLWTCTAGGRIDSPPTYHDGLILFGSADGCVYCLRADDGEEAWRFMAAPSERRIMAMEQVESAWPVHGTVIVQNDVTSTPPRPIVYFTAGRSTYLDGGIYAYGLDPRSGELIHKTCLSGPRPDPFTDKGGAGYMDGAKSDILVSDGSDLFLLQERMAGDLTRHPSEMLEPGKEGGGFRIYPPALERGSTAVHLISTRGFLDDSYNEGTYWTYSARWPGWDRHMNRVPAYGQILSFDNGRLYGVHVFTETVRVRRGFFPGTKGYRLYGRDHDAKKDKWSIRIPVRVRAMVAAGKKLFVAGPPDVVPDDDPLASFEGRLGAKLWVFSTEDGQKLAEVSQLNSPPVYDGLIAASGRLYVSLEDGRVLCLGEDFR